MSGDIDNKYKHTFCIKAGKDLALLKNEMFSGVSWIFAPSQLMESYLFLTVRGNKKPIFTVLHIWLPNSIHVV